VRLVDDAVGLREWLFFEGIEEALHAEILACKGRVVHVLDVFGSLVKVCASGTTAQLVPVHVLTDLSPREIVRHINWHEALNEQIVAGSCRKPDDFKESVLAADMDYDPGVDQTAFHDSAVSLTPPDSNHLSPWFSVRRFARSLTVGWEGVSDRVLCKTLRKGSEGRVPPDGCTISGRLLEALEISNSGRERALVGNLPRDIRFRLGDGEVCDALECAVPRMCVGEIAAICCTDASLLQAGGLLDAKRTLGYLAGRPVAYAAGGATASVAAELYEDPSLAVVPRSASGWSGEDSHVVFIFELLAFDGSDPLSLAPAGRISHAAERIEVGLGLARKGRIRLARERFRRTANVLAVGLGRTELQPPPCGAVALAKVSTDGTASAYLMRAWILAAGCERHLLHFDAAIRYCSMVLSMDPGNLEALFYRAAARVEVGSDDVQSLDDLCFVVASDPQHEEAQYLLQRLSQETMGDGCLTAALLNRPPGDHDDDDDDDEGGGGVEDDEFTALRGRLRRAIAEDDGEAAEDALADLSAALPRLSSHRALVLRLPAGLAEMELQPPGGSAVARELATELRVEITELMHK